MLPQYNTFHMTSNNSFQISSHHYVDYLILHSVNVVPNKIKILIFVPNLNVTHWLRTQRYSHKHRTEQKTYISGNIEREREHRSLMTILWESRIGPPSFGLAVLYFPTPIALVISSNMHLVWPDYISNCIEFTRAAHQC